MGKLFGTDGVRGIAGTELSPMLAYNLGRAGAYVLTKEFAHVPSILVATDTRISRDMLSAALTAGICSVGAKAVSAGVIPTPAVAYLVRKYKLDAGVVISASHNPMEYNGIKFFNSDGFKLRDELENEIESIIQNSLDTLPTPSGAGVGIGLSARNAVDDYVDFIKNAATEDLSKFRIVVDCANGAAYIPAERVFSELGVDAVIINNTPDGTNINKNCGSTHIEELQKKVVSEGADIGIAFDGDADRCLAVDEKGALINGDKIMSVCGLYMKERGKLNKNTIVGTVMSNLGFSLMGEKNGITIEKTKVGDRYVLEKMLECGFNLGGEQSGHIIFSDYNTTGDGLLTAVKLLCVLKALDVPASAAASVMDSYPQVLVNASVSNGNKEKYTEIPSIKEKIKSIEKMFSGEGRVLIRPSGTEPLVRVMIEGKDLALMEKEAKALAGLIEKELK